MDRNGEQSLKTTLQSAAEKVSKATMLNVNAFKMLLVPLGS